MIGKYKYPHLIRLKRDYMYYIVFVYFVSIHLFKGLWVETRQEPLVTTATQSIV